MYLAYFDENKYTEENPYFFIGGFLLAEEKVLELEKELTNIQYSFFGSSSLRRDTEIHGHELFHRKNHYKKRKLEDRIKLFANLTNFIIENKLPINMICIDVNKHKQKYKYPKPEYQLGLMLILERFCDYLDKVDSLGIVFGDYEKDEITNAIIDFSEFKIEGSTPMYGGRALGRLVDTVYFTHSHHSRFLQVADILIFMAGRYENMQKPPEKWHDKKIYGMWNKIKANTEVHIQCWP